MKTKYGNKKVEVDSIRFDSKAEAKYYTELKVLKRAGIIVDFELQPEFVIHDKFKDRQGNAHRAIKYRADFYVRYPSGVEEIVDVKGSPKTRTSDYMMKKKMFISRYPQYDFREVFSS